MSSFTARRREAPPPPPPGYDVIEQGGRFYPVRLEGGYATPITFYNDGKPTRLSGRRILGLNSIAYEPFERNGEDLSYQHTFPACSFLAKWVSWCGGMYLFSEAWRQYQDQCKQPKTIQALKEEYHQLAHAYRFIEEKLERWLEGHLLARELEMLLDHQMQSHASNEALRGAYEEAKERFHQLAFDQ